MSALFVPWPVVPTGLPDFAHRLRPPSHQSLFGNFRPDLLKACPSTIPTPEKGPKMGQDDAGHPNM